MWTAPATQLEQTGRPRADPLNGRDVAPDPGGGMDQPRSCRWLPRKITNEAVDQWKHSCIAGAASPAADDIAARDGGPAAVFAVLGLLFFFASYGLPQLTSHAWRSAVSGLIKRGCCQAWTILGCHHWSIDSALRPVAAGMLRELDYRFSLLSAQVLFVTLLFLFCAFRIFEIGTAAVIGCSTC